MNRRRYFKWIVVLYFEQYSIIHGIFEPHKWDESDIRFDNTGQNPLGEG